MLFLILALPFLYIVLAISVVWLVWKRTRNRLCRWLVIAVAILLPSWDAILATVVYYGGCPFVAKSLIYETAETEGIYYEGSYRDYLLISQDWTGNQSRVIALADKDFKKGYQYLEALVTETQDMYQGNKLPVSPPEIYRCFPRMGSKQPSEILTECERVKEIKSGFVVKTKSKKYGLIGIDVIKIYNRSTNHLIAEFADISKIPYTGMPYYPFFTWLNWDHGELRSGTTEFVSCPPKEEFWNFQYKALKVRK